MTSSQMHNGKHQNGQPSYQPRSRSPQLPQTHRPYTGPIYRMSVDEGVTLMPVSVFGRDRTGIIEYIAERTKQCDVNIVSCFTTRLEEEFSGTFVIVQGERGDLERFHKELKDTEWESVSGKQILPVKLFDVRIQGSDRVGMLYDISGILKLNDINIVSMGLRTVEDMPEDFDFSGDTNGKQPGRKAFIHIRVEVPQERLQFLSELESRLTQLDPGWRVTVKEWKQMSRPDFGVNWFGSTN